MSLCRPRAPGGRDDDGRWSHRGGSALEGGLRTNIPVLGRSIIISPAIIAATIFAVVSALTAAGYQFGVL